MKNVIVSAALLLIGLGPHATAREWTDSTGKYTQEADLVDFDDRLAVLKKADGRLVAVPIVNLSANDREYLRSAAAKDRAGLSNALHDWDLLDGTKIQGKIVDYARNKLLIELKAGMIHTLGKPFEDLAAIQKRAVLATVNVAEDLSLSNEERLAVLLKDKPGSMLQYNYDGVVLESDDGHRMVVPFFVFKEQDRELLKSDWQSDSAEQDSTSTQSSQTRLFLRSLVNEYRRSKNIQRQIQMLELASEWFDLWEVMLVTGTGVASRPTSVVVPARNSAQAEMLALSKHSNARIVGIRRLPRQDD